MRDEEATRLGGFFHGRWFSTGCYGLDEMPDQVPGRMHAGVEAAAFSIDPDTSHAKLYRAVDVMNDPVRFLYDA